MHFMCPQRDSQFYIQNKTKAKPNKNQNKQKKKPKHNQKTDETEFSRSSYKSNKK